MEVDIIAQKTLYWLTDDLNKSRSVNSIYSMASTLVTNEIKSKNVYDFDELIVWLSNHKDIWYYGLYKAVRRFIYAFNDYVINESFLTKSHIYYDSKCSSYKLLSIYHKELISDYCNYKKYSDWSIIRASNNISTILLYLQNNNILLSDISYDDIYNYYVNESKNHSNNYFNTIISMISSFNKYYCDKGVIRNKISYYIFDKNIIKYIELFRNSYDDICLSVDALKNDFRNIPNDFIDKINDFQKIFYDHSYSRKHVVLIDRIIKLYFIFADYFRIGINEELIWYWAENIVAKVSKGYKEYRKVTLAYYDYLITGNFNITKTYNKLSKYSRYMPLWAKSAVDTFITYRTRLGYKKNTINNDKSAILRFILFLDTNGIKSFKEISTDIIIKFHNSDIHSTMEGKNNYMCRIRNFLEFLYDQSLIDKVFNSCIFEGFRIPEKVVKIIDDTDLDIIFKHIELFTSEKELRSICIFLLGVRMGIRSHDIVNLKFENVDFNNLVIKYIQSKTQKEITLPMPVMVANSIFKYVKYGRPKSESSYIFIKNEAPYTKFNKSVCQRSMDEVFQKVGITNKYKGFHITRKTYATNILVNTNDINYTSTLLGHSDNKTVDRYLSLNESRMCICPLDLSLIPYGGNLL